MRRARGTPVLARWRRRGRRDHPGPAQAALLIVGIQPLALVGVGIIVARPDPKNVAAPVIVADLLILRPKPLANGRVRAVARGMAHKPRVGGRDPGLRRGRRVAAKRGDTVGLGVLVGAVARAGGGGGQGGIAFRLLQGFSRHDRELVRAITLVLEPRERDVTVARTGRHHQHQPQNDDFARHTHALYSCMFRLPSTRSRGKGHAAFFSPENTIIPTAPAKTVISAMLNEYGLSIPQHDMFRKSATAPYSSLSMTLPSAPPISSPAAIFCQTPPSSRRTHHSTTAQITSASPIRTQRVAPESPANRPKLMP